MNKNFNFFENYAILPAPLIVEDICVLHGANYFSGGPVIRFRINLATFDEVPTNQIPQFFEKLKEKMPSLYEHHCSEGKKGGFFFRVKQGTLLGHVMEHIAIELQNLSGMDVDFGKTRMTKIQGVYNVVFRFFDEMAGIYAGKAALNFINSILLNQDFDVQEIVKNLIFIRETRLLGPTTQSIVDEARSRKIPVIRLNQFNQVQLGTGKFRKIIQASLSQDTSLIAVETVEKKFFANNFLNEEGIPVPQRVLSDNLEEILAFHQKVQKPIVLKPLVGYQGKRVSVNLNDAESITKAFLWAKTFDDDVIAQVFVTGKLYRILCVDFKFVAAVQLIPPFITGNGLNSIEQLIARLNSDPNREIGDKGKLSKVEVDEETLKILELKNYLLESIPPKDEIIFLKNSGNLRLGASSVDATDEIHPFNKFLAERIAKILNLNVAGIDLICENINVPITENEGNIIEVNAAPDFRMHFNPMKGIKRLVQKNFVNMLFPPSTQFSIPVYSVTGSLGKGFAVEIINNGLKKKGLRNAVVSKRGFFVSDFCLKTGDSTEAKNMEIALKDPTIDAAIFETTVETVLKWGLGYEFAHFGIVLNLFDEKQEYYLYDHIFDIQDIAYSKMVVAEQVYDHGWAILSADNELILEMQDRLYCHVALFSQNPENPVLKKHIEKMGKVAFIENETVFIADKLEKRKIVSLSEMKILRTIDRNYKYDSVLAASLALFLSNVPIGDIRDTLVEM